MIIKCNCKHEEQDKFHGKQMRVHNKTKKMFGTNTFEYRCTVCGKVTAKSGGH